MSETFVLVKNRNVFEYIRLRVLLLPTCAADPIANQYLISIQNINVEEQRPVL